jgi:hypothetical protein
LFAHFFVGREFTGPAAFFVTRNTHLTWGTFDLHAALRGFVFFFFFFFFRLLPQPQQLRAIGQGACYSEYEKY